MEPGFYTPEKAIVADGESVEDHASMEPGFYTPEKCSRAARTTK